MIKHKLEVDLGSLYMKEKLMYNQLNRKMYFIELFFKHRMNVTLDEQEKVYCKFVLSILTHEDRLKDIFNYVSKGERCSMFKVTQFMYHIFKLNINTK